jgi:hypothetical protein
MSRQSTPKNTVDTLLKSHTREEIIEIARAMDLDPSNFRDVKEMAKAILESLPSEK